MKQKKSYFDIYTRIGDKNNLLTIPPLFNLSERDEYERLSPEMIALREELYQVLYSPDRLNFLGIGFRQTEGFYNNVEYLEYLAGLFSRLPDDRLRNRLLGYFEFAGITNEVAKELKGS